MSSNARAVKLTNKVFVGDRWRSRENPEWLALVTSVSGGRVTFEISKDNNTYHTARELEYFREHYYKI